MQNFRELKVWQLGMQLADEVYRLSRAFPKHEIYGLASQTQRAVVSIPANIAEGHAMGSTRDYIRYLSIAQGSLAELETHLAIAERLQYVTSAQTAAILDACSQEARMLRSLRASLRRRLPKKG